MEFDFVLAASVQLQVCVHTLLLLQLPSFSVGIAASFLLCVPPFSRPSFLSTEISINGAVALFTVAAYVPLLL